MVAEPRRVDVEVSETHSHPRRFHHEVMAQKHITVVAQGCSGEGTSAVGDIHE